VSTIGCSVICWSFVRKMQTSGRKALVATAANYDQPQREQQGNEPAHRDLLPNIPEKEPILQLIRDAGIAELDKETLDSLPTWSEVAYVSCCL
jgi:hypothetical protein